MSQVIIFARDPDAAAARAALYAPLRGVRTAVVSDPSDRSVGSAGGATADFADLSLLPVAALHGAIREFGDRLRSGACPQGAALLPPQAALPPDGARIQKLLERNKLRGFIRNTMFLHPAVARVLEVADGGCTGTLRQIRILRRITAHTMAEAPALEALFARRYMAEDVVRNALSDEPATEELALAFIPVIRESEAGWELELTGTAGVLSAWAPATGGGTAKLMRNGATLREWTAPAEHPGRLALAAALSCLARKEPLAFLDFKTAAKSLAFLGG